MRSGAESVHHLRGSGQFLSHSEASRTGVDAQRTRKTRRIETELRGGSSRDANERFTWTGQQSEDKETKSTRAGSDDGGDGRRQ